MIQTCQYLIFDNYQNLAADPVNNLNVTVQKLRIRYESSRIGRTDTEAVSAAYVSASVT